MNDIIENQLKRESCEITFDLACLMVGVRAVTKKIETDGKKWLNE